MKSALSGEQIFVAVMDLNQARTVNRKCRQLQPVRRQGPPISQCAHLSVW